jgi:hypothetical protein
LTLNIDPGAAPPLLGIDGGLPGKATIGDESAPVRYAIRRRAEIVIEGWGRAELTRGSDARSLDQIEADLRELDEDFAEKIAPFGIASADPSAMDQLRGLAADKRAREPELKAKKDEIDRLAPNGLDALRHELAKLEKRHQASEAELSLQLPRADLPADTAEIERAERALRDQISANKKLTDARQKELDELEREIDGSAQVGSSPAKRTPAAPGLRQKASDARERLATLTAAAIREELDRFATADEIETAIVKANNALVIAREQLLAARLNEGEETIRERLDSAKEALQAIQFQLTEAEREFNKLEGELSTSEGLHQKRAAAAARVDQLSQSTQRELLEAEAYDRLYGLFEECRDKQLGAVLGPIHDRVVRWMKLLRIGGYETIRFNDQFLPEKLVASGGATELTLGEESTGTIEQIALMVRLALGSVLSTPAEPVMAVLDDPLTHSDRIRLDRMRAVLKSAAAGDSNSVPPAGPVQIAVFTCHPEWFAIDGAKVVDLGQSDVLSRAC